MIQFKVKEDFLSVADEKEKFTYGFLMGFCLFLGYFSFSFNGIILGKLEGSSESGGSKDFNVHSSQTLIEAVNYSVPFARGIATIPVAWFMKKLTHKYAVIFAMLLNTAAFPLIFSPYFTLFVIGRIIMAFGGTMLVIFVQPILSCFFNQRQKGFFSIINLTAYVFAGLISNLLFVIPGLKDVFLNDGKIVGAISGLLTYIPFIFYIFIGKNFSTEVNDKNILKKKDSELKPATYGKIIKEKDMGFGIFFYSFCLVISVVAANFVPKVIEKIAPTVVSSFNTGKSVYSIIFYLGYLSGFSIGVGNKFQARRKPFILFFISIGAVCGVIILLFAGLLSSHAILATIFIFIFAYIFAFCSLGIQSVIFYVPHEYPGNSPKRITIFFSYMGGFGYLLLGTYAAIAATFLDVEKGGIYLSVGFITILVAMTALFASLIKETRISWPIIPLFLAKKLNISEKYLYHKNIRKKLNPYSFDSFEYKNLNQIDEKD